MLRVIFLTCLMGVSFLALSQNEPSAQEEYERRSKQQKLGQHHIPADLIDAMKTLDEITPEDSKESYAAQTEDYVVERLFFSFGRWLAINWGMYDGSRFSLFLQNMGVDQPDGQKELVMRAYHRHLNGKDLDVKDLVTRYKRQRSAQDSIKMAGAEVIDSFTRPAKDTLNRG